jgi:putative transposase
MIYRPRFHPLLKGARKSFAWQDYRDLLVRAHLQLGVPIIVVWSSLKTHRTAGLRDYAAGHAWLTITQLPSHNPDLNPVEGAWSLLRRGPMANTAFTDPDHLTRTLRRSLAHLQRHPELIDGCLTETSMTLTPDTRGQSDKVKVAQVVGGDVLEVLGIGLGTANRICSPAA